jgi:hypothetical protein
LYGYEPACSINSYVMTSNAGIHSYELLPILFARLPSTRIGPLSSFQASLDGSARKWMLSFFSYQV